MSEIIYIESDAEITEAIDKLKNAKKDSVKLVVPARSALLASVVNLKLLKKAAIDHKRELILITNDKTAKHLAGGIGLAVAPNLKAEAKVPENIREDTAPDIVESAKNPLEEAEQTGDDTADSVRKSDDNGSGAEDTKSTDEPQLKSRALSDDEPVDTKSSKKKSPQVPNFNNLQKRIWLIGGGLIGLILFFILATIIPSAQVTLNVKAQKQPLDLRFTVDSSTNKSDFTNQIVAGSNLSNDRDASANFTATGKKDVGTKASGSVKLVNCEDTDSHDLPAGATLSSSGKNFATTTAVSIPAGQFSGGGKKCTSGSVAVDVVAVENGDSYNLGNAQFSVPSLSGNITGSGSTSGGSSKQITIVSQDDIDKAKQALIDQNRDQQKSDLVARASSDSKSFDDTFKVEVVSFSSSVSAGTEGSGGSVNAKLRYSILAVKNSELNGLFDAQVKKSIPADSQIYDNGVNDANFSFIKSLGNGSAQIGASGNAFYGLPLDTKKIATELKNKPKKEVNDLVQSYSGVIGATVDSWPSLFPNMPALDGNIKIKLKVIQG